MCSRCSLLLTMSAYSVACSRSELILDHTAENCSCEGASTIRSRHAFTGGQSETCWHLPEHFTFYSTKACTISSRLSLSKHVVTPGSVSLFCQDYETVVEAHP